MSKKNVEVVEKLFEALDKKITALLDDPLELKHAKLTDIATAICKLNSFTDSEDVQVSFGDQAEYAD